MRRVVLLALLTLALPTAALASITFLTGTFESGTIERNLATGGLETSFQSSMTGSTTVISLANITLIGTPGCAGVTGTCTFDSGTVTVQNPTHTTLFTGSLVDGRVTKTNEGADIRADITAEVLPVSRIFVTAGFVNYFATFEEEPNSQLIGRRALVVVPVPEPGTLSLLGTGFIGLAEMVRRRLKLRR